MVPVVEELMGQLPVGLADVLHVLVRDLRRLLVGALAEADAVAAGDRLLDVGGRAVQVRLEDDADVVVGLAEAAEQVQRPLRVLRAFHVDADEAADLARGVQQAGHVLPAELPRDVEAEHGQLDRDVALDLRGDPPQELLVRLRAADGGLPVEDVFAQQVEGGPDAARVELPAGGDGRLRVRTGHEASREDERRRDHRRRPRLRAGASYSALTTVEIPPRTWKSPSTVIRRGFMAATRSSRITLV